MNSLTAFAAAVSSATNANASAGIFNYNTSVKCEKPKMSLSQVKRAHSDECASSGDSHQIGTNLADQSVCWHRVSMSDNCQNCGHPYYEGKFIFLTSEKKVNRCKYNQNKLYTLIYVLNESNLVKQLRLSAGRQEILSWNKINDNWTKKQLFKIFSSKI